jgi:hypothetical protein
MLKGPRWLSWVVGLPNNSYKPTQRGFAPGFVNYNKGFTRLTGVIDKVYQLLAHGLWFFPASSTTKTGRHDIAEILLKVTLSTINQIKSVIKQLKIDLKYISFCM